RSIWFLPYRHRSSSRPSAGLRLPSRRRWRWRVSRWVLTGACWCYLAPAISFRASTELGHVPTEHATQRRELRQPIERCAHVGQAGRDPGQEVRVLFHPVDVNETASVLELALDGL